MNGIEIICPGCDLNQVEVEKSISKGYYCICRNDECGLHNRSKGLFLTPLLAVKNFTDLRLTVQYVGEGEKQVALKRIDQLRHFRKQPKQKTPYTQMSKPILTSAREIVIPYSVLDEFNLMDKANKCILYLDHYDVEPMPVDLNVLRIKKDVLYIAFRRNEIDYLVKTDKNGREEVISDKITEIELEETIQKNYSTSEFNRLSAKILKITEKRGHTLIFYPTIAISFYGEDDKIAPGDMRSLCILKEAPHQKDGSSRNCKIIKASDTCKTLGLQYFKKFDLPYNWDERQNLLFLDITETMKSNKPWPSKRKKEAISSL